MIKDLVLDFLREEGYAPKVDNDGDIVFKAQRRSFLYFANDNDQNFFQLVLPGIYDITPENREKALEACNAVARQMKVAKPVIIDRADDPDVWIFFENLLDNNPNIGEILPRAIDILLGAQQSFYEKVGD